MTLFEKLTRFVTKKPLASDTYYHECGHVIVAKMFPKVFKVNGVTADSELSRLYDNKSEGGMMLSPIDPLEWTVYEFDMGVLVALAGMCADDVNNENGRIRNSLYNESVWRDKFENSIYGGDIEQFQKCLFFLDSKININYVEYIPNTLKFLHSLFLDDKLWAIVNKLRKALIKSHTLSSQEIDQILAKNKFEDWLKLNKIYFIDRNLYLEKKPSKGNF